MIPVLSCGLSTIVIWTNVGKQVSTYTNNKNVVWLHSKYKPWANIKVESELLMLVTKWTCNKIKCFLYSADHRLFIRLTAANGPPDILKDKILHFDANHNLGLRLTTNLFVVVNKVTTNGFLIDYGWPRKYPKYFCGGLQMARRTALRANHPVIFL